MADLDLNELERLEKAATPGPWEGPWGDTHTVAAFEGELHEHSLTNDPRGDAFPVAQETQPNDAALIAAMRNALPDLLAVLRTAEAHADELESALRDLLDFARRRIHSSYVPPQGRRAIDLLDAIDAARKP